MTTLPNAFLRGLLAIAALLAVGSARSSAAENLFPATPGSTWTFSGTVGANVMTMTATITSAKKENGKTIAVMQWTTNGKAVQDETYIVTASEVTRSRSGMGGSNVINPPIPVIKNPMAVGKSWTWQGKLTMGNQMTMPSSATLKVAARETIKTSAGTFNAYRVDLKVTVTAQGQTQTIPNSYWFAPGVGMVQQEVTLPTQTGQKLSIKLAVTKYKIK